MKLRSEIKNEAKKILSANYWPILGEMILVSILTSVAGAAAGIGSLIVGPPLAVGFYEGIRILWEGKKKERLFTGFDGDKFGRSIGSILLMCLFIGLWTLLLVIPGIIKAISYSMTPFIVADSEGLSATDAITLSSKITQGYKGKILIFVLSYIGWWLLTIPTLGMINIFYINPYIATAFGGYYKELKEQALKDGVVTMADFGYADTIEQ